MNIKLSKIEKIRIIHISSMVILSLLTMLFIYLPRAQKIGLLNVDIKSIRKVIGNLQNIQNDISGFNDKKLQVEGKINIIKEEIPLEPMVAQVLEQITKPMNELGITLVEIKPLEPQRKSGSGGMGTDMSGVDLGMGVDTAMPMTMPQPISVEMRTSGDVSGGEAYFEIPIELSVQGTYRQVGIYLNVLRQLPRLVVVDGFEIKSNKDISPKIEAKLKLSVYNYGKK